MGPLIATVASVYLILGILYLSGTLILSRRKRAIPTEGVEPELFVFVVPALNESSVIVPTVNSLLAACGSRGRVLVVDDGSTDDTAQQVEALVDPRVYVLKRRLPDARLGKGRALNHAYRFVRDRMRAEGHEANNVALCIVDADGRVQPDVLEVVAPYFRDQRVGAVQLQVRIRNRDSWMTRFQDYEFLVFCSLTQTAREHVGSVGLGGNGQFTRLAALDQFGDDPWTDCLTEDLDLGLRLAIGGWQNRFCGEASVDQQGLKSITRLVRQRTRWAQGHFQCWSLVPRIISSRLPSTTVLDLCYYLLAPGAVLVMSLVFSGTLLWALYQILVRPELWLTPFGLMLGVLLYLFSFGPAMALSLVYRSRSRELTMSQAILLGHLLVAYNYIWYVAELKAIGRICTRRGQWRKTARVRETSQAADVDTIGGSASETTQELLTSNRQPR